MNTGQGLELREKRQELQNILFFERIRTQKTFIDQIDKNLEEIDDSSMCCPNQNQKKTSAYSDNQKILLGYTLVCLLQYPSSELAKKHCQIKKVRAEYKGEQINNSSRQDNYDICRCCNSKVSKQVITMNKQIQKTNAGVSICLYFRNVIDLTILLSIISILFSSLNLIANVISSLNYKRGFNGVRPQDQFNTFDFPVTFSFGSTQFYEDTLTKVFIIIARWSSVLVVLIIGAYLYQIKQNELTYIQKNKKLSQSDYTLIFKNIKIKQDGSLPDKFKSCFSDQFQKPTFLCALPFNVTKISAKDLEIEKEQFQFAQNQLKQWLQYNYKNSRNQSLMLSELNEMEKAFKTKKKLLLQTFKKVLGNLRANHFSKSLKEINVPIDVFVTFSSIQDKKMFENRHNPYQITSLKDLKNLICCGNSYIAEVAPQPEDIVWKNYGQGFCEKLSRTLVMIIASFAIMVISFIALYSFSTFNEEITKEFQNEGSDLVKTIILKVITQAPTLITNSLIQTVIMSLAQFKKSTSYTEKQVSKGMNSLVFTLVNSIAVPLMVNLHSNKSIYGVGGFAQEIFYFSISDAAVGILLTVFNTSWILNRVFAYLNNSKSNKWFVNQRLLNEKNQLIEFEIGIQYSTILFTYIYTCFFASLQPVIVIFAAVKLFLTYFAQKWSLYNYCRKPNATSSLICSQMFWVISLGPLAFCSGTFIWTFHFATTLNRQKISLIISLLLSLIIIFLPFKDLVEGRKQREQQQRQNRKKKEKYNEGKLETTYSKQLHRALRLYLCEEVFDERVKNLVHQIS